MTANCFEYCSVGRPTSAVICWR